MVKTSLPNSGSVGSILDQGSKAPGASKPKHQNLNNRNNIVTNSIKTSKMVHIKKNLKGNKVKC